MDLLKECSKALDRVSDITANVYGDEIVDEYIYVNPNGKSGKETYLSVELTGKHDSFRGGVGGIARQMDQFCKVNHIKAPNLRPTIKTRYVHRPFAQKMFGVTQMAKPLDEKQRKHVIGRIGTIPNNGLLVIADFGHGAIVNPLDFVRDDLYTAVNVQTNSSNFGFNLATKYQEHYPDFLCIDEVEARLATGNRYGDIEDVAMHLRAMDIIITRGHNGIYIHPDQPFDVLPATIVDRMGAGDAVFSLASLLRYADVMDEVVGNLCLAIGACACGILGNSRPVTRDEILSVIGRIK